MVLYGAAFCASLLVEAHPLDFRMLKEIKTKTTRERVCLQARVFLLLLVYIVLPSTCLCFLLPRDLLVHVYGSVGLSRAKVRIK